MGPEREGERERRWVSVLYHSLELYHESFPVLVLIRVLNQYTSLQRTLCYPNHLENVNQKSLVNEPNPRGPVSFHASPHHIWQLDNCWRRSSRGWDHWLTKELDLDNWEASHPLPCPQNVLPTIPIAGNSSRTQPWETKVLLRPFELWIVDCDWTWLKPLYKLWRFWQAGAEIIHFAVAWDKPLT